MFGAIGCWLVMPSAIIFNSGLPALLTPTLSTRTATRRRTGASTPVVMFSLLLSVLGVEQVAHVLLYLGGATGVGPAIRCARLHRGAPLPHVVRSRGRRDQHGRHSAIAQHLIV